MTPGSLHTATTVFVIGATLLGGRCLAFDRFGESVAIDGNLAAVGSPRDDGASTDSTFDSGSVYLFDATTGQRTGYLTADDAAPLSTFGWSVSVSNGLVLVGAPDLPNANPLPGAAYLFDGATGQQLLKFAPAELDEGDGFGISVALDGDLAAIGASGDDDAGNGAGAVYVFDVTTGQQVRKLTAPDALDRDSLGRSVAVDGDIVLAGAPGVDRGVFNRSVGAAYYFDGIAGDFIRRVQPTDLQDFDLFGFSVALEGGDALFGLPFADDAGRSSGRAYLDDGTTTVLNAAGIDDRDRFGYAVGIDTSFGVVGAPGDEHPINGQRGGTALIYPAGSTSSTLRLFAEDGSASDDFGYSVGVDDGVAIVGAPFDDAQGQDSGAAYLFDVATGEQIAKLEGDPALTPEPNAFALLAASIAPVLLKAGRRR